MSAVRSTALARLLDGLVDYAGLFPPAALSMRKAVQNYAVYRHSDERAMLGRFVVPVARLDEFAAEAAALEPAFRPILGRPWALTVLAAATDSVALDSFNATHVHSWRIDTVEARAATVSELLAVRWALAPRYTVYVEVPVREDPGLLIAAAGGHDLRVKIRTGGVTAEAFPTPAEVLRFLEHCAQCGVAFKATAGLHHPLRGEFAFTYAADSPRGPMYGFLNLFLAALFLRAGHASAVVAPLLEERDASAVDVTPDAISWRGLRVDSATIASARATFAGSFGSCSFEEPVRDLAALDLLPAPR